MLNLQNVIMARQKQSRKAQVGKYDTFSPGEMKTKKQQQFQNVQSSMALNPNCLKWTYT